VSLSRLVNRPNVPGVSRDDRRYRAALIPDVIDGHREGEVLRTVGYLHVAVHEDDDDYHLQLSPSKTDGNDSLIVEVPSETQAPTPALATRYAAVRTFVRHLFGEQPPGLAARYAAALAARYTAVRTFIAYVRNLLGEEPRDVAAVLPDPVCVAVVGQLFYDDTYVGLENRGKQGQTTGTLWELHPIVSIASSEECDSGAGPPVTGH